MKHITGREMRPVNIFELSLKSVHLNFRSSDSPARIRSESIDLEVWYLCHLNDGGYHITMPNPKAIFHH
jgi:hypothetical protein